MRWALPKNEDKPNGESSLTADWAWKIYSELIKLGCIGSFTLEI